MSSDLDKALAEVTKSQPGYAKACAYAQGTTSELFFSAALRRHFTRNNAEIQINLSKVAIDVVADRLEISALSASGEREQAVIEDIKARNKFDLNLPYLFRMALEYGDAYLILDGDPEEGVTFHVNNPQSVRVFYAEGNSWEKSFAVKRWRIPNPNAKGELTRVNLYYADRIERWVTTSNAKGEKATDFIPFTTDDETDVESVIPNPYGFVPVYHFRTGLNYGRPEHADAYSVQDSINKLAMVHLSSIEMQGFPQRVLFAGMTGDGAMIDNFDADAFHDEESPEAVKAGPAGTDLVPTPGGMWHLPSDAKIDQFSEADSKNFIEGMGYYATLIAQTTNTPLHYVNQTNDAPSGESLRTAEAPLIKKVRNRQMSFGGSLQDALEDALRVYGIDAEVTVTWASAESSDSMDTWSIVKAKRDAGVPTYDAFLAAGLTPDQLEAMGLSRDTPEHADVAMDRKIARLNDIAKAAQGFAVAVTAGILDAATVQTLILSQLGQADGDAA